MAMVPESYAKHAYEQGLRDSRMFWAAMEAQVERDTAHKRIRWLEERIKVLEARLRDGGLNAT